MGSLIARHGRLIRTAVLASGLVIALAPTRMAAGSSPSGSTLWSSPISASNAVVSTPTSGGGYPENPPVAGGCVGPSPNNFNANHSESHVTVQPGTEQLDGSSKFFFDKFSTIYNFYLGSYNINNGSRNKAVSHSNTIVQGYDCSTT